MTLVNTHLRDPWREKLQAELKKQGITWYTTAEQQMENEKKFNKAQTWYSYSINDRLEGDTS